jgi:hypothetical protein
MHCSYPYGVDDHCAETGAHIRTPPLLLVQLLLLLQLARQAASGTASGRTIGSNRQQHPPHAGSLGSRLPTDSW